MIQKIIEHWRYVFATQWQSTLWLFSIMMMTMIASKTESTLFQLVLSCGIVITSDNMYKARKKAEQKFDEKIRYCYNESEAADEKNAPT